MLKIATQSYGWYDHNDPEGSISFIKSCGFDAIDFNIDALIPVNEMAKSKECGPYESFFDKSTDEILDYFAPMKAAAERHGITFCQAHGPDKLWFPEREELNEYLIGVYEKCFALCAFLGAPALVVHPIQRPTKEEDFTCNMAAYTRLIPFAKKYGVKICLENLFVHRAFMAMGLEAPVSDAAEACRYVDTLNEIAGEDLFGFCFDVGHAVLLRRNIKEFIKALGKRLTILHIHENDGRYDEHSLPYTGVCDWNGTRACDWDGFIEGLREIGYRGALSFEVFRLNAYFPRRVWPELFRLVSAIGRDWSDRICEGENA